MTKTLESYWLQIVNILEAAEAGDEKRLHAQFVIAEADGKSVRDLNLIVELEGQSITKNGSLRHPRIKRFRPDKSEPNQLVVKT